MKQKGFNLTILLTLLLASAMTSGQDLGPTPKKARTLADYKPRSMKEVSTADRKEEISRNEKEKVIVRGDILPSRVRLTYAGRSRILPQPKKDVLYRWAQLYAGAPEHYTQPYEMELLFREGKTDYWVAVRKQAMAQFKKEVKNAKTVALYLIRLGWVQSGNKWESMLLVEDYQLPK